MKEELIIRERRKDENGRHDLWKIVKLTEEGNIHILKAVESTMIWYRPNLNDLLDCN